MPHRISKYRSSIIIPIKNQKEAIYKRIKKHIILLEGGLSVHIELYQMADGTEPVADFLQSLDKSMHAKAMHTINLLEARGHLLRSPYSKELENGSWSFASVQETIFRGFSISSSSAIPLFSQTVLSRRRRKHRP